MGMISMLQDKVGSVEESFESSLVTVRVDLVLPWQAKKLQAGTYLFKPLRFTRVENIYHLDLRYHSSRTQSERQSTQR